MKLVICTNFFVSRMNRVESRRGVGFDWPPSSMLRVIVFSSRLLGLSNAFITSSNWSNHTSFLKTLSYHCPIMSLQNINLFLAKNKAASTITSDSLETPLHLVAK